MGDRLVELARDWAEAYARGDREACADIEHEYLCEERGDGTCGNPDCGFSECQP